MDPRFIHAVIWQESKYELHARSHAGAQGLMQLMPATAKRFGCNDPNDPVENITAGTKYLSWLFKRFSGNVELALAGYNAGEGSVDKYDGVPPYNETRNYVKIISKRYGKTYHPVLSPEVAAEVFQLHSTSTRLNSGCRCSLHRGRIEVPAPARCSCWSLFHLDSFPHFWLNARGLFPELRITETKESFL